MITLPDRRLSIQDVADFWGVHYRYVWALVNDNRLPSIKLGKKMIRIRKEDVIRFETEGPAPWDDKSETGNHTSSRTEDTGTSGSPEAVDLAARRRAQKIAQRLKRS